MIEDQVEAIRERMQKILESMGNSHSAVSQPPLGIKAADIKQDGSACSLETQAPVGLCSVLDEVALGKLLSWAAHVPSRKWCLPSRCTTLKRR